MDANETIPVSNENNIWSAKDLLRIMYLIFGLLGVFGNGLVIYVFLRVRSLMNFTNLFIGNQSLIDLVSSIFLLISKYRDENSDQGQSSLGVGKLKCLFWSSDYVFWALLAASTTNLVFLTLERYMALVLPVTYRNRVNWHSAKVAAVFAWIFGFILQLYWPAVHQWTETSCYPDWRSPLLQAVLGILIFLIKHLIPIMVMVFVYVGIVMKLNTKISPGLTTTETNKISNQKRQDEHGSSQPPKDDSQLNDRQNTEPPVVGRPKGSDPKQSELHQRVRRNVIKTLLLVGIIFTVCSTPNQVTFLCYNLGIYQLDFNGNVYVFGVLLAFCNIWINPFIYTFKYRKFQQGLRKIFGLKPSNDPVASASTTIRRG